MARPFKCRRIAYIPGITYFKPTGIPLDELEEVVLSLEEAEALRLKELEELEQEQGAQKMNVSRPTFQRILAAARQKVADAILNGKAIRIEGGNYEIVADRFRCRGGHEWKVDDNIVVPAVCPRCDNAEIQPVMSARYGRSRRGCKRHGGQR
ncbi:MAG: DUF134 domain-containing protein [Dehalococcoidales bacterium]|nr:DUF134 domain-containing protein [Dehalococcoidales bacterium]